MVPLQHGFPGQHVVPEADGHGDLQMREARHDGAGLALGEVDDLKYATAAGAISFGFPTIADTRIPQILPTGVTTYEHVVSMPFDEIPGADDMERTEKLIQDGMRKLMDDKTSFSIAHRLATIRDSSRIMVLNGGAIEELASHDDLMAEKGFYHSLYMSQFKGKGPGGDAGDTVREFVST